MNPRLSLFLAIAALSGCASQSHDRSTQTLTPEALIERSHRYAGGLAVVTGYLRYHSRRAELWQSAEAAASSDRSRSCIVVAYDRRSRDFLRRHDGQMVRLRGFVRRYNDIQGEPSFGGCNVIGLRLLWRDF